MQRNHNKVGQVGCLGFMLGNRHQFAGFPIGQPPHMVVRFLWDAALGRVWKSPGFCQFGGESPTISQ